MNAGVASTDGIKECEIVTARVIYCWASVSAVPCVVLLCVCTCTHVQVHQQLLSLAAGASWQTGLDQPQGQQC